MTPPKLPEGWVEIVPDVIYRKTGRHINEVREVIMSKQHRWLASVNLHEIELDPLTTRDEAIEILDRRYPLGETNEDQ